VEFDKVVDTVQEEIADMREAIRARVVDVPFDEN
jgi:transcription termination factor Rho